MRASQGLRVGALCGVQFIDVLGVTSAITALPDMLAGVGAPQGSGPIVASVYAAFFGGLLILGSKLGDRYGHRRVLILGTIGFALVGVVGATAPGVAQLVVARVLQGTAAAISVPSALTLLLATAEGDLRQGALAAWSASGAMAGASGLVVGGLLTQSLGWPSVFWLNLPVGLLLALGVRVLIPASPATSGTRLNPLGSALLVGGVALVILGASLAEVPGLWLPAAGVFAAGLASGGLFVAQQRRSPTPLLPPAALASDNLRTGSVISFVNTATTSSAIVLASLYLQQHAGYSAASAGLSLLPVSLGAVGGSALSKPLSGRLDPHRLAAVGLLGIAVGTAVLALVAGFGGVLAGTALMGTGLGISSVAGNDLGTSVEAELRGLATGIVNTAAQLGTAIGIALLMVLATVVGHDRAGTTVSWLCAVGIAVATALVLYRRGGAPETQGA